MISTPHSKAFTMIELILVIIIIGVLAMIELRSSVENPHKRNLDTKTTNNSHKIFKFIFI